MALERRDVVAGALAASGLLFVVAVSPMLRDPSLRHPIKYAEGESSAADQFVAVTVAFGAIGWILNWTANFVTHPPKDLTDLEKLIPQ